ncbi:MULTISPECIES: hypothetical protein [unclassified Streptococcus]|uniref:hypothetical protein n=1 Tax=unclassified Streptococcus TaxID=2608887 RepID=UPI0010725E97|nr:MULTISPECIES: hypothetical protein [unclassified Streptococcus]MBF0786848.1 hypothetical protein [Streptococcus sp. 19428wC2_LYSM12]MCQ9212744.1 hypothetical protein [Streptococcus sp. B01]MCQ9214085.1 hypothetical protein [Streptococcus sp. O1]TFV06218.1 hypothetical protein E4T79_02815 [Streptococcus sp. LYSM12]
MPRIKEIIWISKEIGEADVIVTDGNYEIMCFSHPFYQEKGEEINGILSVFEHSNLMRSQKTEYVVNHMGNGKYFFVARLIDGIKGIVQIGKIQIHDIEGIPEEIKRGEYIQFITSRVDLW